MNIEFVVVGTIVAEVVVVVAVVEVVVGLVVVDVDAMAGAKLDAPKDSVKIDMT